MLRFPHTSDHTLVYITVHTSCEMRLRNDRVGDGGQCKHNVASGSARSGWRSAVWPVGDFFWGYLLDEIQTLCIIHPIYGLPLDPLSVRTHTHTHKPCVYININNQEDTMVVLFRMNMWSNEPCPGCWLIQTFWHFAQTTLSRPQTPCKSPHTQIGLQDFY